MTAPRKSDNIVWSESLVSHEQRAHLLGQQGCVIWFTGLSGCGKSTIARALELRLLAQGRFAYVLDGDNVRHGLCGDLGFTAHDRSENIRRIGEVANLFADAGTITLTAFISPYAADRDLARRLCGEKPFIEVHLCTPLAVCEARDPKGLYARARAGQIRDFTGIDAPYEAPSAPELRLDTGAAEVEGCVDQVLNHLHQRGVIAFPDHTEGSGI
jgi:adenylylsulfate kinase